MDPEKISPITTDQNRRSHRKLYALLCAGTVLAGGVAIARASLAQPALPSCSMQDLPTLGGLFGAATGANGVGDIVGTADDAGGHARPVAWRGSAIRRLAVTLDSATPVAVNGSGTVIGFGRSGEDPVGWVWSQGNTILLRALGDGAADPVAINDSGVIVGALTENQNEEEQHGGQQTASVAQEGFEQGEDERAAVWSSPGGLPQLLPALPGDAGSRALAVDPSGRVGGVSEGSQFSPVVWDPTGAVRALPTLGGGYAVVRGFGRDGVIVGDAVDTHGVQYAVRWTPDGHVIRLPMPPGARSAQVSRILPDGSVIGIVQARDNGVLVSQAMRWPPQREAQRLGDAGAAAAALAWVGNGVIAGHRLDADGGRHPVQWHCEG
jgi:uncharacterized membrane protein